MRIATLKNKVTGVSIKVHASTNHPDCHYGHAVWVDSDNIAYCEVDAKFDNPIYEISEEITKEYHRACIGKAIAQLRTKKGYTQQQLADKTGLKQSNVARVEQGRYNVGLDILQSIADALNADVVIKPR